MFRLHPRLAADTLSVTSLALCEVRLMNDRRFPWVILVPQRAGLTELHQLSGQEQRQLLRESARLSRLLEAMGAEKINVGALGNLVPQLHWHVVARSRNDPCWPGPVWGCGQREAWPEAEAATLIRRLRDGLDRP